MARGPSGDRVSDVRSSRSKTVIGILKRIGNEAHDADYGGISQQRTFDRRGLPLDGGKVEFSEDGDENDDCCG